MKTRFVSTILFVDRSENDRDRGLVTISSSTNRSESDRDRGLVTISNSTINYLQNNTS